MICNGVLVSRYHIAAAILMVLTFGAISLRAQSTYTGQLSVMVKDPSGAVIVGPKVTLTEVGTNAQTGRDRL
jgi:hypothetical protein